jgi:carbon-monoxide dehydrogenase medium subunit
MMPWIEAFHRPTTIPEALRLVRRDGRRARFVAGATDVLVQSDPSTRILVDVTRLKLNYIKRQRKGWAIGAATTMAALEQSREILRLADGILAQAAATCGSVQNRNMATVGGNLANASPAADSAPPLLVLDAEVVMVGPGGRRRLPLTKFFHGVRKTALNGALLLEVFIPPLPRGPAAWSFHKLARLASDISVVNAVVGLGLDPKGHCRWARIALGAVAPTPLRLVEVEKLLQGKRLDAGLVAEACERVCEQVRPITDVRSTSSYRREMCGVLVRRALRECAERMGHRL